jgi:ubiquinone biosynthesis protein Coq4
MREPQSELGIPVARGLVGVASVAGGPTEQQRRLISTLLHSYFGVAADASRFDPMTADELAEIVPDEKTAQLLVQAMIVLEFCRHPATPEMADSVERYAGALGVSEPMLAVGRSAAESARDAVIADWSRFREAPRIEASISGHDDVALAARLRDLARCPAGSLGRGYFDFYERYGLNFPGEPDGGTATLVSHDFAHVLAGYEPNAVDEIALQAMLTSSTSGDTHFSGLVASLGLYEVGMLPFPGIDPKTQALARPRAAEELAHAVRRGSACSGDFQDIDHLEMADESIDKVRHQLNIPPRMPLTPGPWV